MSANLNEIMLHIDETLDDDAMYRLEEDMRTDSGVVSVGHNARQSHMIMVVYDSESTQASNLLRRVEHMGLHGQIIGL